VLKGSVDLKYLSTRYFKPLKVFKEGAKMNLPRKACSYRILKSIFNLGSGKCGMNLRELMGKCLYCMKELFLDRLVVDRVLILYAAPFCTFVILCYLGPHHRNLPTRRMNRSTFVIKQPKAT